MASIARPELVIGNKNYSSWSFRPWLAMRQTGIDFTETLVPFDMAAGNPAFFDHSPVGRVPVLNHNGLILWESLPILEYLAETFADKRLWPQDREERALARVWSGEMHSGFGALRNECPMNMRRKVGKIDCSPGVGRDVARIEAIWSGALDRSGGPFLLGHFTNLDAMYAPVVNRLQIYDLTQNETARRYMTHMMGLPAWREWQTAGEAEPWIVEEDEA